MIENLNGIHETVNYKENTNLRLYVNDKNENYPAHWHTPMEIIMPTESEYTVIYNNHTYTLRPNDIIFICPGVIHTLLAPKHGCRIIFQADFSSIIGIRELESFISFLYPIYLITPEKYPSIYEKLREALISIKTEYLADSPMTETQIYSDLMAMLVLIGRQHTERMDQLEIGDQKQKEYADKFIAICNYINKHCTEDMTLEQVASLTGFSKYHFSRLFKQFTGFSFYKYVNQKRIANAETLLIDPKISVTEAALQSGFSSISAFTRMFKLIKHCTPTEFRKLYSLSE